MNSLVPHVVEHAVRARTALGASQSFGAVAVTLLMLLLVEWEALRLLRRRPGHWILLSVLSVPLAVVVALVVLARVLPLIP